MSYPRLKRLSVLHFAILGHEIGHLFFQEWKHNNLNWFYKTNSVEKAIDDHVDEIISKKISQKNELKKKYSFLLSGQNIILLQHSVTTQINESQKQIRNTLDAITKLGMNTIAIAPNSDPGSNFIFNEILSYLIFCIVIIYN